MAKVPRIRVYGRSKSGATLQKVFDAYSDYLEEAVGGGVAERVRELVNPGHGINISSEAGGGIVVSEAKALDSRVTPWRIDALYGASANSAQIRVHPGFLIGVASATDTRHHFWPLFQSTNSANPAPADFAISDGEEKEFWLQVTGSAGGSELYVVESLTVDAYAGSFTTGIHADADLGQGAPQSRPATLSDDDVDSGDYYVFLGAAKMEGGTIYTYNVRDEHIEWFMAPPGGSDDSGATPMLWWKPTPNLATDKLAIAKGLVISQKDNSNAAQHSSREYKEWEPGPWDGVTEGLKDMAKNATTHYWVKASLTERSITVQDETLQGLNRVLTEYMYGATATGDFAVESTTNGAPPTGAPESTTLKYQLLGYITRNAAGAITAMRWRTNHAVDFRMGSFIVGSGHANTGSPGGPEMGSDAP